MEEIEDKNTDLGELVGFFLFRLQLSLSGIGWALARLGSLLIGTGNGLRMGLSGGLATMTFSIR